MLWTLIFFADEHPLAAWEGSWQLAEETREPEQRRRRGEEEEADKGGVFRQADIFN